MWGMFGDLGEGHLVQGAPLPPVPHAAHPQCLMRSHKPHTAHAHSAQAARCRLSGGRHDGAAPCASSCKRGMQRHAKHTPRASLIVHGSSVAARKKTCCTMTHGSEPWRRKGSRGGGRFATHAKTLAKTLVESPALQAAGKVGLSSASFGGYGHDRRFADIGDLQMIMAWQVGPTFCSRCGQIPLLGARSDRQSAGPSFLTPRRNGSYAGGFTAGRGNRAAARLWVSAHLQTRCRCRQQLGSPSGALHR